MAFKILLRKVEGASVALIQNEGNAAEILPTRYDLFQYRGGFSWGYKGSGVRNLAYAIGARLSERTTQVDIEEIVEILIEDILSQLDGDRNHDLDGDFLLGVIHKKPELLS